MSDHIHLIDPDYRRRAQIFREFSSRGLHTEIYEGLAEFSRGEASTGYVFAADGVEDCGPTEIVDAMRERAVALPLVMYSDRPAPDIVVSAMLCGASDYLEWPFRPNLLSAAFKRLVTVGAYRAQQEQLRSAAAAKIATLSRRERDVLIRIVNGLANKEIAIALRISPRTVEVHRANLMRKLDAQSASDAVRIALYAGLDAGFRFAA